VTITGTSFLPGAAVTLGGTGIDGFDDLREDKPGEIFQDASWGMIGTKRQEILIRVVADRFVD
jgi:hypothetical protein